MVHTVEAQTASLLCPLTPRQGVISSHARADTADATATAALADDPRQADSGTASPLTVERKRARRASGYTFATALSRSGSDSFPDARSTSTSQPLQAHPSPGTEPDLPASAVSRCRSYSRMCAVRCSPRTSRRSSQPKGRTSRHPSDRPTKTAIRHRTWHNQQRLRIGGAEHAPLSLREDNVRITRRSPRKTFVAGGGGA